jgi:hypothetical protein
MKSIHIAKISDRRRDDRVWQVAPAACFLMISLLLPVRAATVTIGETQVLPTSDGGNANLLLAQQATLSQAATIQSLSFHVLAAAGNLRLGIYDGTGPGGGPGAKKAETSSFAPVAGWNTANVISPVFLPAP